MPQETPQSRFVVHNALLAARLSKRVGNHLSVHGLSLTEFLVMRYLHGAPRKAVPRIELAEHLGMSASGITRLVAPMEKNGIVEKEANPRDARQSLVKLSETGQRLYVEARQSFEHIASDMVGHLGPDFLRQALELFVRLGQGRA